MPCNCNTSTPAAPVSANPANLVPISSGEACLTTTEVCGSQCATPSSPSTGTTLPDCFTDAADSTGGVTLLTRIGTTLARIVGTGYLFVKDSKTYLVESLPLKVTHLWHQYIQPSGSPTPIAGNAADNPFDVIADAAGNLYAIQGLLSADSVRMWDFEAKTWRTVPANSLPVGVAKQLEQTSHVELTGFEEVPLTGDSSETRNLKALAGKGIVYLSEVPVAGQSCDCGDSSTIASVATVAGFPEVIQDPTSPEVGRHVLVFSSHGLKWESEM